MFYFQFMLVALVLSSGAIARADQPVPTDVNQVLAAVHHAHDNFLNHYRAVSWDMGTQPVPENVDVFWRDGDNLREKYYLPPYEPKSWSAPMTADSVLVWTVGKPTAADQLADDTHIYCRLCASDKISNPQVQVIARLNHAFPFLLASSHWPEEIQWPVWDMKPDFQLIPPNAESADGWVGLRTLGDSNDRHDYYFDTDHDYICVKQINWKQVDGHWFKSRETTLSNLRKVDGKFLAARQRSDQYNLGAKNSVFYSEITTINIQPISGNDYP